MMRHRLSPPLSERVLAKMAHLLDCDRAHLHLQQRLEADLDFTPLERVQLALDFERAEGRPMFLVDESLDALARAVTVHDLVQAIEDASRRRASREEAREDFAFWLACGLGRGTMKNRPSVRAHHRAASPSLRAAS